MAASCGRRLADYRLHFAPTPAGLRRLRAALRAYRALLPLASNGGDACLSDAAWRKELGTLVRLSTSECDLQLTPPGPRPAPPRPSPTRPALPSIH
eukprot:tig00020902_g15040.t1